MYVAFFASLLSLTTASPHETCVRMKSRGDTGQIKRAEENLKEIKHLHAKMDAVMAHLQIPPVPEPQSPMEMKR